MIYVVKEACTFSPSKDKGVIVIESDHDKAPFNAAFDELNATEAVTMAQAFATKLGVSPAYLNGSKIGPYPVNKNGKSLDAVLDSDGKQLPATHALMQPARYRVDIPVARPIR